MATIDGRPAQYGITLKQLRELMEHRGREGVGKIQGYGGVQEICKKLYTSPSDGKTYIYSMDLLNIDEQSIKQIDLIYKYFRP